MVLVGSGSAAGAVYPQYGGQSKFWFGTATTVSGVATFYPTDDGTGSGNPLFMNIAIALVGAKANVTAATDAPLTSIKLIAADRKSITVNCVNGVVLVAAAATLQLASDGTAVNCMVWGD